MKLDLTKESILALNTVFSGLKRVKETKFAYAIARNIQVIKGELESLDAARSPDEKFKEYDTKRHDLILAYKNSDLGNGQVQIKPNKMPEFTEKLAALESEYSETLKEFNKKVEAFSDLLKEKIELDHYGIKAEYLPADLSSDEMLQLMPLITGDIEAAITKEKK